MSGASGSVARLGADQTVLPDPDDPAWVRGRRLYAGADLGGRWLAAFRQLSQAGCGRAALLEYLYRSCEIAEALDPEAGLALGAAAASIARTAGVRAAAGTIQVAPRVARLSGPAGDFQGWCTAMRDLAAMAPESAGVLADNAEGLMAELDVAGFRAWALTGVRQAGGDPAARFAFFAAGDPRARGARDRAGGAVTFVDVERSLQFMQGLLWGDHTPLRALNPPSGVRDGAGRRATLDESGIRLPQAFPGVPANQARPLYQAALAHAGAHRAYSRVRFPVRRLKPLQVALVSLIEDARVEALAIRRYPGLARLWRRFHVAEAGDDLTAPGLMARLARALIDPEFDDRSAWVQKGRRMFLERADDWHDPEVSRTVGMLLGNDLGQMRVQFNANTYVVEPPYRDDNAGLWYHDQEPAQAQQAEVSEGARAETANDPDPDTGPQDAPPAEAETLPVRPDPRDSDPAASLGPSALYPEWDYVLGQSHPDWTTVIERLPPRGPADGLNRTLTRNAAAIRRLSALIRAVRLGRPTRLRRQPDGDRLDLDAAIEARIDQRAGCRPDTRVFARTERRERDQSVLVLIDASQSTNDVVPGLGRTVLRVEREAVAVLGQALADAGDPFAVQAFRSNGRGEVDVATVKTFDGPFDRLALSRLAGLTPGLSTRMGAAMRHAGRLLETRASHRRLLLVVTDGEPSDVDVADPRYLVEDARHAVQELAGRGIDTFCVGLDGAGGGTLRRIFGRRNAVTIDRVARLPDRLASIYLRLTQ